MEMGYIQKVGSEITHICYRHNSSHNDHFQATAWAHLVSATGSLLNL